MSITLPDIHFLASQTGDNLLQRLANDDLSENNTLSLLTKLRREFAPEQGRAALEMARLRLKATEKFGDDAQHMFFTREALEQASDPLIRRYRVGQIITSPNIRLVDACCGIGADTLAFAAKSPNVLGLDKDPVRVEIARHNAAALGLNVRFEIADVREGLPDCDAIFFDPARRDEQGKRIYNVERYQPPLSTIRHWKAPLITVKVSPGVDLAQLDAYNCGVEFISVNGDLKEALLWLGAGWNGNRATLLTNDAEYHWDGASISVPDPILSEPRGWLVEPDPSLLRAGLVQQAAGEFGGTLLDETIAYFTAVECPVSPWVRVWQILDWMPFNVKILRAYLRERNVGNVTVKKRGSAVTPEALIPQLKLKGDESRVVVLTRYRGQPIIIVCADYVA